ncbi:MAG: thioredoxin domain-containing protein [Candidatus Dojkabacteria bacterium]|nr:thioredoxin domain-containing protein [Candidatus Dojkabacteria bacterium]MDQ7021086.1 thioredoxin domain-containing protein [Candidatus Dojkabacteria bacterium]
MLNKIPAWVYIAAVAIIGGILIIALAATKEDSLTLAEEDSVAIAEELNLDIDKFKEDMASSEISDYVESEKARGEERGVTGTPAIFINGETYEGTRSYEAISSQLENLLDNPINDEKPTFEVYADFNCPNCAAFDPLRLFLSDNYGDRVEFISLPYPFLRDSSFGYARAFEAAKNQGAGDMFEKALYSKLFPDRADYDSFSLDDEVDTTNVEDNEGVVTNEVPVPGFEGVEETVVNTDSNSVKVTE